MPPTHNLSEPLLDALNDSITAGNFIDSKFYVFSRRASAQHRRVDKPRALYANSHVLQESSSYFDSVFSTSDRFDTNLTSEFPEDRNKYKDDHDYYSDSDLEDAEETTGLGKDEADGVSQVNATGQDTGSESPSRENEASIDSSAIQSPATPPPLQQPAFITTPGWPRDRGISLRPQEAMTLDSGIDGMSNSKTTRALNTFIISNTAFKTFHALVWYTYTGEIEFSPLGSAKSKLSMVTQSIPQPSAKSIYLFAREHNLVDLQNRAYTFISTELSQLSPCDLIEEAFTRFASWFPAIRELIIPVLCDVLRSYGPHIRLFKDKIDLYARGKLPYCADSFVEISTYFVTTAPIPEPQVPDSEPTTPTHESMTPTPEPITFIGESKTEEPKIEEPKIVKSRTPAVKQKKGSIWGTNHRSSFGGGWVPAPATNTITKAEDKNALRGWRNSRLPMQRKNERTTVTSFPAPNYWSVWSALKVKASIKASLTSGIFEDVIFCIYNKPSGPHIALYCSRLVVLSCSGNLFESVKDSETESGHDSDIEEDESSVYTANLSNTQPDEHSTAIRVKGSVTTWTSLLWYLYTENISFAPLRSQGVEARQVEIDKWKLQFPYRPAPCSPKSMHTLAKQLSIINLENLAERDIKSKLRGLNAIEELFPDSPTTNPILHIASSTLSRDISLPGILPIVNQKIDAVSEGAQPHATEALTLYFDLFLGKESEIILEPPAAPRVVGVTRLYHQIDGI